MSYILEALKKSEQERGHGSAPGIQSVHSSGIRYSTTRSPVWPFVLMIAVAINLAALAYFIFEGRQPAAPAHTAPAAVARPAATGMAAAAPGVSSPAPEDSAIPALMVPAREPEPSVRPEPVETPAATTRAAPAASADAVTTDYASRGLQPAGAYTPQRNELPAVIERQIPIMDFSAHVYSSNPRQRSIVINGRFMEEGEAVSSDLVLDEITPGGAIFDFLGYRFHQSVISTWN